MKSSLYFIALLIPSDISDKITVWKQEVAEKYGARHALKSPPHITLQMPFRRPVDKESAMVGNLSSFASGYSAIYVHLSGFGCFPPRVIYVDVNHPGPVIERFDNLQKFLMGEMNFSQDDLTKRFHPHITLATRDLKKNVFPEAWSDFKDRQFQATFVSKNLTLLKHTGKSWEVFQSFPWRI